MPFPLLAAAAPIIASGVGALTQMFSNRSQRKSSMELAKYQYEKDLEMWNRNNEYNNPANQMARLTAAGLNPNLVYGNGSATGNTSSQTPKFNAPNLQFGIPNPAEGLPATISMFQDFQIKKQQLNNLKAQEEAIRAKTANTIFQNEYLPDFLRYRNTGQFQKTQGGMLNFDISSEKLTALQLKNKLLNEGLNFQLEYMKGRNRQQESQIAKIMQDTKFTELKTDWFVTQLIAKFGTDAAKLIMNNFSPFGRMKSATDVLRKGSGSFNTNKRPTYNSPTSWRNMGY